MDSDGQRVWFVDRAEKKVIGTVDRRSGETTGPDDTPPAWATVEGGTPLGR